MKESPIYKKLLGNELPFADRLRNIMMLAGALVMLGAALISAIEGMGLFTVLLTLAVDVICLFALFLTNWTRYKEAGLHLFLFAECICIMPLMHFVGGGTYSGMPEWEILGTVFIWVLATGKSKYAFVGLYFAVISFAYHMEMRFPELVFSIPTRLMQIIDSFFTFVFVSVCIGMLVILERRANSRHNKELEESKATAEIAMRKYETASAAKSDFLSRMSHEIRTPINAIMGMNEMILREAKDEEILEYASSSESAAHSLLSLINEVLDMCKIDEDDLTLEPVEYSMSSLLNDCYNLVEEDSKKKNIGLSFRNNPYIPARLYGDEVKLRRIITNLLTNAVKFTTVGEVVASIDFVHVDDNHLDLKIDVSDTGIGIKDEDKPKVFERFSKFNAKDTQNIEGTGIGLNVVQAYVNLMGGTISFESEYGKGSTFSVSIIQEIVDSTPLGSLSELRTKDVHEHSYSALFKAPTASVLSVDDVKMNHDVLKALLKKTEVKVDTAYSGIEAINLVKAGNYDLILMDHMMPEMDGIEAFHEIQKIPEKGAIPCLVLTANALTGVEEEYLKEGFSGYLSKPIKPEDLEKALAKFLPEDKVEYLEDETVIIESDKSAKEPEMSEKTIDDLTEDVFRGKSFIDLDYGLECCAGMLDLYAQAVLGFVGSDNKLDVLDEYFEAKDWDNYRVNIHAVKSSALLLGIRELSEHAKSLEYAIKEGSPEYVLLHHKEVMEEYLDITSELNSIMDEYNVKAE